MWRHGNIAGLMLVALVLSASAADADPASGAEGGRALPNWSEAGDEAVRNLAGMVKIDTSSGNETKVARYIKAILDREGIESEILELAAGPRQPRGPPPGKRHEASHSADGSYGRGRRGA